MYKVLIQINDTREAGKWCIEHFGRIPEEYWTVIHRGWRKGGPFRCVDENKARWSFRYNKKTSTWKFKYADDAVLFKLRWG